MRFFYQLHYEANDKRFYFGEYHSMAEAIMFYTRLMVSGDGQITPREITKVELTAIPTKKPPVKVVLGSRHQGD